MGKSPCTLAKEDRESIDCLLRKSLIIHELNSCGRSLKFLPYSGNGRYIGLAKKFIQDFPEDVRKNANELFGQHNISFPYVV